jgi:hypothetical protein
MMTNEELQTLKNKLALSNLDKLRLIRASVEEDQQNLCGESDLNNEAERWLEASPVLLDYLDTLIEMEEECPTSDDFATSKIIKA